ncbi:hypothetical protein NCLIV_034170 [Neospora caninum Liverpool]|uniref:Dynein protein, putative n=1 Tax=Neospora caninum (strain Liverpool) TaxID=572307 RepID=F0VIR9_NEOCL|nr:hypothetical protein NCLIV_034170 [Neospora caninum Liverpool]CBZ53630.1 hypothetical protein NCLIV_034170 [Neospora caninum Liverpool]CEL67621.1 TPA: dynein protein, putative [Neospora caninum Liverpool]|eukprot:XP_003883662.1 hypothetical protein NCLIV_034170 [Neospora caninum Liverpool]
MPCPAAETEYNTPLFAFVEGQLSLSLEDFDDPDVYADPSPEEWVRRCASRRRKEALSRQRASDSNEGVTHSCAAATLSRDGSANQPDNRHWLNTGVPEPASRRRSEGSSGTAADSNHAPQENTHRNSPKGAVGQLGGVPLKDEHAMNAGSEPLQFVEQCSEDADVLHFLDGDWRMTPCWVLDYLKAEKKFRVRLKINGTEKTVHRLSLRFGSEDPVRCQERADRCRRRRDQMRLRQSLINLIHGLQDCEFPPLGMQAKQRVLKRLLLKGRGRLRKFDHGSAGGLFNELEDLHMFAMKFSAVRHKTFTLNGTPYAFLTPDKLHSRFGSLFVPLLPPLMKETGCERVAGMTSLSRTKALLKRSPHFKKEIAKLVLHVANRFWEIQDFRFLDINRGRNRHRFLPGIMTRANHRRNHTDPVAFRLDQFIQHQQDHCADVKDVLEEHWREFIYNETMATLGSLGSEYQFYVDDSEKYTRSDLRKILRKIDIILSHHMMEFIQTSIADWKRFFLSFVADETYHPADPLLILDVHATENGVRLSPDPATVTREVSSLLDWVIEQSNRVTSLEKEFLPFVEMQNPPLYEISATYEPLKETREVVQRVLQTCLREAENYLALFNKFAFLSNDIAEHAKNARAGFDPSDLSRVRECLKKYHAAMFEIQTACPTEVKLQMIILDCSHVKETLSARAERLWKAECERVSTFIADQVAVVMKEWSDLHDRVLTIPATEEELGSLKTLIATINELADPLTAKTKFIHEAIDLLASFNFSINKSVHEDAYRAFSWPLQIKSDLIETGEILEQGRLRFEEKLEADKVDLEKDLSQLEQEVDFVQNEMTDFEQAMEHYKRILQLQEKLTGAKNRTEAFTKAEALFGLEELSDYSRVDDLIDSFEPFRKLWALAVDFKYGELQWLSCTVTSLDPTEVEMSLDKWTQEAYKLRKHFLTESRPMQVSVADELHRAIDRFRQHLPLIRPLCNEAFLPRHWADLLRTTGCDLDIEEGFSLTQLLESGIASHLQTIEEKSELAQKEFTLKSSLVKMKFEWKAMQIQLIPFRDTKTCVMKGFDVVQALLEDHLVRTQTMRGSRFIRCIDYQSRDWETKLLETQQALDSLQVCQRSWMYLQPIFQSADISKQIPQEAGLFREVDALWRRTIAQAEETPGVLDIVEFDNLHHDLTQANAKLAQIMRGLNDFLETKRLAFPRFFFLSNEELLAVLSQTKDLSPVQMHLNKCFEGIHRVAFGENGTVINAIQSAEGEEIPLARPVALIDGTRFVGAEYWLGEVESSVGDSLRGIMDAAMKDYPIRPRTEWCLSWPGQVALTASQIFWTSEVAAAISDAQLPGYLDKCNDQLQGLVRLVRGSLTKLNRLTVTTLLTIDVHARDVVEELKKENTSSLSDFEWIAQLRLSWQLPGSVTLLTGKRNTNPEIQLSMINARIFYGFEYLGNTERLVITPLTDRCYRTLIGAFHLQYGGAPEGPAGTGKTETTKDLAKAAGMQCLVFNCSDGLDYVSIGRFFKGLVSSGAWCCFDEFNRIDVEVLSVIAQQVHAIQQAIRNQVKVFLFEGTDVKLVPSCAINITMNPGYAGRSDLPDNLKALFRPCAMMIPDSSLIAEVVLYSYGFADARNVARKALACLRLSSEQLSSQDHYDFGMRALKAILTAAGHLKRTFGSKFEEDELALYALEQVSVPKFTPSDTQLFRGIVSDLFPGVKAASEDYGLLLSHLEHVARQQRLQPTEAFLAKCIQLWDTIKVRHGLMLVGATLTGKTAVLECLAAALESASEGPEPCAAGESEEAADQGRRKQTERKRGERQGDEEGNCSDSEEARDEDEEEETGNEEDRKGKGAGPGDQEAGLQEEQGGRRRGSGDGTTDQRRRVTGPHEYMPCKLYKISPKSVSQGQLYGKYDENTQEWTDGVLAIAIRTASGESEIPARQWIVLDGPVDAVWIENMNTVLDDNKKLCLTSGEIIKLSALTTMIFEVEDLSSASPATVSRCGMVYLDQTHCTWEPMVTSWIEKQKHKTENKSLPSSIDDTETGWTLTDLFLQAVPVFLQFLKVHCTTPVAVSDNWLASMSDKDRVYMRDNLFFFALIWSFGACVDESSRPLFDAFFRRWLAGAPQLLSDFHLITKGHVYQPRPQRHGLSEHASVFDVFFDKKAMKWLSFSLLVPSLSSIPSHAQTYTLVVPTPDTARNKLFLQTFALHGVHALLVGATGTGKTTCISAQLKDHSTFNRELYTSLSLCFSAKTTANEVQDVIDSRVDRTRKTGVFAPSLGRKCLVFLDDLNLPAKEVYGAQPVIELLRQWHSMGGWYNRKTWQFRQIENIQFLAAMGIPGGSRQHLTPRYLRHFNLLYLPPFSRTSLVMIFDSILSWKFRGFATELQTHATKLLESTIEVYGAICSALPPTPSRSHYTFNLRDLARVVEGLCYCTKDSFRSSDDLSRCWFHEFQRVFSDRLVCREDKAKVFALLSGVLETKCKRKYRELVDASTPLLFCDFVNPKQPYYQQVTLENLRAVAQSTLAEYNALYLKSPMNLVFFAQALKHLTRVVRILQQPKGNGLLVGFGGSGRKSLTRLATFLVGFETTSVEVTRSYGLADWREDVKTILVKAGGHGKPLTFLLSDSQLANDAFLDDVANLLNTGEIPNLFSTEDKIGIFDLLSRGSAGSPSSSASSPQATVAASDGQSSGDLFEHFVSNCRQNLHIMLFFSPSGENLRHKIRLFPALVNCCAINWFSQWSEHSLEAVAREELRPLRLGSLLTARGDTTTRGKTLSANAAEDPDAEGETDAGGAGTAIDGKAGYLQAEGATGERTEEGDVENGEGRESGIENRGPGETTGSVEEDADVPDSASQLCSIFACMQLDVNEVTNQYRQELRRHYYITPRSYIEFLKLFSHLSVAKREELNRQVDQYRLGLEKIHSTSKQVEKIQGELECLRPQLIKASQDTAELMVNIAKMQESAALTKATVEVEEAQCKTQADAAAEVKEQCKTELDTAMPALTSAIEALKKLSKSDITELNSMKTPPAGVVKVVEALCKMFGIKPSKVKSADSMRKADDYWTASKKHLLSDTKFLQRLFTYDKDHIPVEVMNEILPYQTDPDFDPDVIKKASVAATSLCKWVRAIIVYDQVAKVVGPKQKNLEKAEAELAVAAEKLDEKKRELKAVEELLGRLLAEHKAAESEKEELKNQFAECSLRLQVAERLINDLAGENTRWNASFHELRVRIQTLLGELLVTSAVIAYSGVFPADYRQRCLAKWRETLAKHGVALNGPFDMQRAVGDSLQIQTWIVNMLPHDSLSIENALILSLSTRWPMLIDPQNQATRWLKKTYPDMIVLRASGDAYFRSLQIAVEMGSRVLIEHCSEELDPSLDALLSRAVFKAGNIDMIRLRDTTVEYSKSFHLSLSTLLGNPHFSPEICAQLTMLNFSVTPEGLEDQLLGVLVTLEQPAIEAKRQALIVESASSKKQLQALEEKILHLLSNAKGDILDDRELIGTLSSSKAASQAIEDRVAEQKKTVEIVESTRAIYRPVAFRTARLFFVVADLASIDRMYHFSVEWFLAIFVEAIETEDPDDMQMHLEEIDRQFLSLLYENVCRSLFEKDKLLFPLLLALTSMRVDGELDTDQLQLLLRGGITGREISASKPAGAEVWLSDLAWTRLVELQENAQEGDLFSSFLDVFQDSLDDWKRVFDSEEPLEAPWPDDLDQSATELEKCLLIQALRPDCLVKAMRNLVEDKLGAFFLDPPAFDLSLSYKLSTPARPLVFALSAGADPMNVILKLAETNKMAKRLVTLSLGQGQGPKAIAAIETATSAGAWILLQNCHLGASFLPQLERIVEDLPLKDSHPDFRLFLTSAPSPHFPESVLLNSVKVTNEPPRGLRQNLLRSYLGFDETFLEDHPNPAAWKNVLFALCFFHAMLLERRKFGHLGWNVPYEFSHSDMQISIQQLRHFVGAFDQIPWKTLKYLAAETNYGGRITDPWDRRLINYLIDDVYTPGILQEGSCLCASEGIMVPPATCTYDEYLRFIRELPTEESPEVYTLHMNANMSVAISEANFILDAVLSLLPRTASGNSASGSSSTRASLVAQKIQDQLPDIFDIAAVEQKYPIRYEEIFNTVLIQELSRYNRLLTVIKTHLKALQDAEKGLVLLTPELEDMGNSLSDNRVPGVFSRFAYPSMKPLSSWIKDLIQRAQFFRRWIDEGPPTSFWLPAFFFTQSFLTAILQRFSRHAHVPIDEVSLDFEVLPPSTKSEDTRQAPSTGCYVYGLYLEGARWDDEETVVAEAHPGILFCEMPMIWIEPCEASRPRKCQDIYECPVYKTAARAGTLSTTGHSTNYVLTVRLPINPQQSSAAYWAKRGVALLLQLST